MKVRRILIMLMMMFMIDDVDVDVDDDNGTMLLMMKVAGADDNDDFGEDGGSADDGADVGNAEVDIFWDVMNVTKECR